MKMAKTKISNVFFSILIFLILAVQVYPMFFVMSSSFKTIDEFRNKNLFSLPGSLDAGNFINVLTKSSIGIFYKNSIITTVFVIIFIVVLSSMAAFAIEKLKFKYNKLTLSFFLLGIMIPIQVTLIPLYQIFSKLKMINSYEGLIVPQVGFGLPVSIFLFTAFYSYIPNEIIESATIDGCSIYRLFTSIILPLSKNTIVTVATLFGVSAWNEFIFAFTFTSKREMMTIPLGLNDFIGFMGLVDWGATFAAITLTVLPTIIIYFILSKKIISGMTAGAVKA
jgi:raffinose/stachyose/melibiose transport system permease protein